ncbi:PQQ-binding-like beta-propeller repeat protein [Paenibacillus sp. GM2]|uniref:outer membrane protein assembly factor BamB family protein n=1 Tax=Paenibacillus sp. GM2 TaxID=1622070 RepID=UPI000839D38B|nr:PQQ-binding-like beta-propeller repeat protein [Paenibacillus sp. GM2]
MLSLSKMAAGLSLCTVLILSPLDAALGAEAGHTTFAATDFSSTVLPKKGDSLEAQQRVPLFPKQLTAKSDIHKLNASYYGQKGERFKVRDMKGELLKIHSDDRGEVWTPLWYWTKDAGQVVQLGELRRITLSGKAKLALTPNSSITWDSQSQAAGDAEWVAAAQWKSWVAVLVNPEPWQQDGEIYQPVLLWIQKQDIASEAPLPPGSFAPGSKISTDMFRNIASWLLVPGTDSSDVKKLLGAPQFIETSGNLQQETGKPMQLGKTWRYERPDGQFLVTFSQEGMLERIGWIIPGANESRSIYTGEDYRYSYHFMNTPMPETLQADPLWRQQGDLDFAYLLAATPDILLIKGDDGGFSGMHQSSNIYAVTRADGKKLWQVEAGFGILQAEAAGELVTILTDYNPEAKQYENRLRQIRLSDGKVLWEKKSGDSGVRAGMGLAQNSVIMLETPDAGEKDQPAQLSVFDNTTGKLKWKREVPAEAQIFNAGSQDPYVLVRDQNALNSYDPNSGRVKWAVELQGPQSDYASYDAYYPGGPRINPFEPPSSSRWMLLGDHWMLLDLQTGNSLADYALTANERIELIDQRYLLVQRPMKTADHTGINRSEEQYESALYDAERGRELWTMKGRASKGTIAGDALYLLADGIPAAVRLDDGKPIWQMNHITAETENMSYFAGGGYMVMNDYLLLPYGPNLIVIDRQSGELLGRMENMLMGYAELRELESRNGTINSSGDELYVGTANGATVRFSLREIEQEFILRLDSVEETSY